MKLSKKLIAIILAVAVVLGVAVFALTRTPNNYKAPVKILEEQANSQKYKSQYTIIAEQLNGFCEKEFNQIVKMFEKTEEYKDELFTEKTEFEAELVNKQEEFGKNFKYKYSVAEKIDVEQEDIDSVQSTIREYGAVFLENYEQEIAKYSTEQWQELADELDVSSPDEAKKLMGIMKEIAQKLKTVKITDAYELKIDVELTGSKIDTPEVDSITISVYKVNGRWINSIGLIAVSALVGYQL